MSGNAPIIIKRKKVIAGGGHHGGAWKVAYADFVTAMMAFFLLMWLLNATTEEQRKGIADYFNPTVPLAAVSGGGTDALSGDTLLTEDTLARSADYEDFSPGGGEGEPTPEKLKEEIEAYAEGAGMEGAADQVRVKVTEEGTVIELVDADGKPLFDKGAADASENLKVLIQSTVLAVKKTGAAIKIVGHTDSYAYPSEIYSNWELSADRANTARRMLIDAGIPARNIQEVVGKADREPITNNPADPVNRRIAIVLLSPPDKAANRIDDAFDGATTKP